MRDYVRIAGGQTKKDIFKCQDCSDIEKNCAHIYISNGSKTHTEIEKTLKEIFPDGFDFENEDGEMNHPIVSCCVSLESHSEVNDRILSYYKKYKIPCNILNPHPWGWMDYEYPIDD